MIADRIDRNLVLVGNVPKRVAYLKDYVEQHNLSERVILQDLWTERKKRAAGKQLPVY